MRDQCLLNHTGRTGVLLAILIKRSRDGNDFPTFNNEDVIVRARDEITDARNRSFNKLLLCSSLNL